MRYLILLLIAIFAFGAPIHKAVKSGNLQEVKGVLNSSNIELKDKRGNTPLCYAAYFGYEDILKYLVDSGADTNAKCWSNNTPLHFASYTHHFFNLKYLLDHKANVNLKGWQNNTPLIFAAFISAQDSVKELLKRGADINAQGYQGNSALHFAAFWGYVEIVKILLENGANKDLLNDNYKTPLDLAKQMDRAEIIELLGGSLNSKKIDLKASNRCKSEYQRCIKHCQSSSGRGCEFHCELKLKNCYKQK